MMAWARRTTGSLGMVQMRVTAAGGWGRRPEVDAADSEPCAGGSPALPARPQPPSVCHPPSLAFEPCRSLDQDQCPRLWAWPDEGNGRISLPLESKQSIFRCSAGAFSSKPTWIVMLQSDSSLAICWRLRLAR